MQPPMIENVSRQASVAVQGPRDHVNTLDGSSSISQVVIREDLLVTNKMVPNRRLTTCSYQRKSPEDIGNRTNGDKRGFSSASPSIPPKAEQYPAGKTTKACLDNIDVSPVRSMDHLLPSNPCRVELCATIERERETVNRP